ncbi:MAG: D-alanine--D-alanine ligase [Gemmatimonadota bacterium]|nr:D-alanine--D-alanine ligase [Gemmatimonadota bacterium]MDH4350261.1 D-alanine--D-alanine ligase [Gemmatimonadota bacterium]MDH5196820.1 D-alanine--D-alanine ligase [Gemmatimonadota bacterium]
MRIGLAYNQRPSTGSTNREAAVPADLPTTDDAFVAAGDAFVEWDEPETIDAVAHALHIFGEVVLLEAVADFPQRLAAARVDLLFNMAEGVTGPSREAHVPAIAEFLGVPYTASDPLTLALALHKGRAKEAFLARGIPTAPYALVDSDADLSRLDDLAYPAFLKPVWEGSSKGIAEANYVTDAAAARRRAREILTTYRQPVLAEEYLPGDEFTVAVLGNGSESRALPIIRYLFETLPEGALPIMGYEAKWVWDAPGQTFEVLECPARVSTALALRITDTALAAARALGCRDWARVDVRLDGQGVPNVVEVNPLPGVIPNPADNSCFPCAARAVGMSYDELIQTVVRIAWRRLTGVELPRGVAEAAA